MVAFIIHMDSTSVCVVGIITGTQEVHRGSMLQHIHVYAYTECMHAQ